MTAQTTIVIVGATGDLAQRKLVPALYNIYRVGRLPEDTRIVGFARKDFAHDAFIERLRRGVEEFSGRTFDTDTWQQFAAMLEYVQGDLTILEDYIELENSLRESESANANRLYYLAIAPGLYETTATNMGEAGMADDRDGYRRVIIEKPFGRDEESARKLNETLHAAFREDQIYRIDHYLGKETAQNILFFRFANSVFESIWDRRYIDAVQITVFESIDVGHRATFYDQAGIVRDIVQNHILQLLTLVAMDAPGSFEAQELRNEKVKVLNAIRPVQPDDTVRAQYEGYLEAEGVAPDSQTATFTALKLYIDNWRWSGVPFYIRSGKAVARKASEVVIQFKRPPHAMFDLDLIKSCTANVLSLCIQPDEGIHFKFETKVPGSPQETRTVDMEFHYDPVFGENAIPEAYERLLLDAISGDPSLFIRSDEIEKAWRIVDPVIDGWLNDDSSPLRIYPCGSWGPQAANELIERDGFNWQLWCIHDAEHV